MLTLQKNHLLWIALTAIIQCVTQAAEALDADSIIPNYDNSSSLNYQSEWRCGDEKKFAWYCEAQEDPRQTHDIKETEATSKPSDTKKLDEETALEKMDALNKEVKEKEALAILDPTPEHVKGYVILQNQLMHHASVFTDVWQRTIWQDPSTNIKTRPVNAVALRDYDYQQKVSENKTMNELTNEWGIFFIFKSDCPYCHRESTILNMLNKQYGMTVFPISMDGVGTPEFPNPAPDNGLAGQLGVTTVPQMYLGNVKDHRMIPLGTGVVAMNDLVYRIYVLTQTKPGDDH